MVQGIGVELLVRTRTSKTTNLKKLALKTSSEKTSNSADNIGFLKLNKDTHTYTKLTLVQFKDSLILVTHVCLQMLSNEILS